MVIGKNKGQEYGLWRYAVLFSEIEGKLKALKEKYPENLRYDVMGHSNEGRELFLVTLAQDVSDTYLNNYSEARKDLVANPKKALENAESGDCPPLPILINCNLHGTEISGTDGMFTFIEEVLGGSEKERYLNDSVILIAICQNPDGRSRGLDILNGQFVDLNRDWIAQTQPETRSLITGCVQKFYPTILVDQHGYMSSGNIMIDACTPPHNPLVEYDLLENHLMENSKEMARVIKTRTNLDTDIPALIWDDGWEDYSPVYTTGYFMCCGSIAHTVELNFPTEEGAYVAHCCSIGTLDYVHAHKIELYKNQCVFYLRGIENVKNTPFHTDYYLIKNTSSSYVGKTINQLLFNNIAVYTNENGDYVVPLAQPLRPLIQNMLWQGEDISDKINNCYDVSFYSYSVMRGLDVQSLNQGDVQVQNLTAVTESVSENPPVFLKNSKPRILTVTESGYTDTLLEEHGYQSWCLPFSELNTGYRIDTSKFDILVVMGSQTLLWEDAFNEERGIGYQNSWGLRERGRREVIRAAGEMDRLILGGYSGMKVNEELNRIDAKMLTLKTRSIEDDNTSKYMINISNGSFKMDLDTDDPLCRGYRESEILYLVGHVAYESADAKVAIRYGKDCFINGFNKNKGEMDGHIAACHRASGIEKTVLFGFDPAYRGYTDHSYGLLFNAISIVSE